MDQSFFGDLGVGGDVSSFGGEIDVGFNALDLV
jgi:hypothetical protein